MMNRLLSGTISRFPTKAIKDNETGLTNIRRFMSKMVFSVLFEAFAIIMLIIIQNLIVASALWSSTSSLQAVADVRIPVL